MFVRRISYIDDFRFCDAQGVCSSHVVALVFNVCETRSNDPVTLVYLSFRSFVRASWAKRTFAVETKIVTRSTQDIILTIDYRRPEVDDSSACNTGVFHKEPIH